MNEWISVKDRLPEKTGDYIVYARDIESDEGEMGVYQDYYDVEDGEWEEDFFSPYESKITHWMPMPQPPKKEEKN